TKWLSRRRRAARSAALGGRARAEAPCHRSSTPPVIPTGHLSRRSACMTACIDCLTDVGGYREQATTPRARQNPGSQRRASSRPTRFVRFRQRRGKSRQSPLDHLVCRRKRHTEVAGQLHHRAWENEDIALREAFDIFTIVGQRRSRQQVERAFGRSHLIAN